MLFSVLNSGNMTNSPFEVGFGVSLNKGVHRSDAALVGFGISGRSGY